MGPQWHWSNQLQNEPSLSFCMVAAIYSRLVPASSSSQSFVPCQTVCLLCRGTHVLRNRERCDHGHGPGRCAAQATCMLCRSLMCFPYSSRLKEKGTASHSKEHLLDISWKARAARSVCRRACWTATVRALAFWACPVVEILARSGVWGTNRESTEMCRVCRTFESNLRHASIEVNSCSLF